MRRTISILLLAVMTLMATFGCGKQTEVKTPTVEKEQEIIDSGIVVGPGGFEPQTDNSEEEPVAPVKEVETVHLESSDDDFTKTSHIDDDIKKTICLYGELTENELTQELAVLLGAYEKNISIVAMSLEQDKTIAYNTNQTYFSACTIKTSYVLACCKMIDEGAADKESMLTYEEKHFHKGSGKIKDSEFGTKYSIEYLIRQCLYISDNVAYKMLIDYFGFDYYNKMIEELGCDSLKLHDMWARSSKVKDFVVVWNEVNRYFETSSEMAIIMKDACTNTPFNYGTRTLGVSYSHKSGDNFGDSATYSDAGIVWGDAPYIYAVFTNSEGEDQDTKTVERSMEIIHELLTK